jgi:hypothetical protein
MTEASSEDRRWLVTTSDPGLGPGAIGHAAFVLASDEADAVTEAAHLFLDETGIATDELGDVVVLGPFDEPPPRWRVVLGAEPVPERFWCCGGMPFMDRPGTYDEHTATCPTTRGTASP